MADKKAKLIIENETIELNILNGTLGPDAVDVSSLFKYGHFTFDAGFNSTAACESKITFIDGDKGILLYRGYPIEQLAEHCDFLETCYLLLYSELPNAAQKRAFVSRVTHHTMVNEQMQFFLRGFRRDAHPMADRSEERRVGKECRSR